MKKVKKGMTLLEVVISLAIIAIMIIPLMNSLLTAVTANKKGEEVQDAKLLGQQVIEKLRVQDVVKAGNISMDGFTIKLDNLVVMSPTSADYFPVSTLTEVDGLTIEGKVYEDDAVEINDSSSGKEYLNKKLGGLLVVSADKVEYYVRGTDDKSIIEIYEENGSFKEKALTSKDISITFSDTGTPENRVYKISLNETMIATDTTGGIGIYVREKNDFKFNINNNSVVTQDVVIFRDKNLSQEEGMLASQITEMGILNMYTNIIFDLEKSKTGLYTAELEIKKDGKTLEQMESQFYLGE